MITENKRDELIFDFLEGNLSPDEEQAFRVLIDESELLHREVKLWQNTYQKDALPKIEALENKLFIHRERGNFSSFIYTLLMTMVLMMVISADRMENGDSTLNIESVNFASGAESVAIFEIKKDNTKLPADCYEQIHNVSKHPAHKKEKAPSIEYLQVDKTVAPSGLITTTPLLQIHPIALRNLKPISTEIKTQDAGSTRKKMSRYELRMLRKKLRQDHLTRQINEFRSGNEPYVVPLNSNNF